MNLTSGGNSGLFKRSFDNLNQQCEPDRANSVGTAREATEETDGSNQEWRLKARVCSDGPGEAARDRKQGRQSESRRRPQGKLEPLGVPGNTGRS
jgi:hypothetical protein